MSPRTLLVVLVLVMVVLGLVVVVLGKYILKRCILKNLE